jgi:hypothetical protein
MLTIVALRWPLSVKLPRKPQHLRHDEMTQGNILACGRFCLRQQAAVADDVIGLGGWPEGICMRVSFHGSIAARRYPRPRPFFQRTRILHV